MSELRLDVGSFEEIDRQFRTRLQRHCHRIVRDRQLADDIVQETFLRAWRALDRFDKTQPMWPWLIAIAQRVCWDQLHKRDGRSECALENLDESGVTTPDHSDAVVRRAVLDEAFSGMNPRYRRLLVLKDVEGWSSKEIAEVERATMPSVAKVLARARAQARSAIDSAGLALLWPRHWWRSVRRATRMTLARISEAMRLDPAMFVQGCNLSAVSIALLVVTVIDPGYLTRMRSDAEDRWAMHAESTTSIRSESLAGTRGVGHHQAVDIRFVRLATPPEGQDQSLDPTNGGFRIDVNDPWGRPILYVEDEHGCSNDGNLAPPPLPVTIRC